MTVENLIDAGMDEEMAGQLQAHRGVGCRNCSETGFKGRLAIYEVMELREELKEFVLNGASALELKREAMRLGMKSLRTSAFEMLGDGVTTLGEVLRVSTADN